MRIGYEYEGKEIYLQVNNVFNELYNEYGAISTMYNERGFYPSPERNFVLGVKFSF